MLNSTYLKTPILIKYLTTSFRYSQTYMRLSKKNTINVKRQKALYRSDTLQDLLLGLNSLCRGAESKYFNGHTNIKDGKMINFLIRGIMDTNAKLRDTILFNLLSYIQNRLLTKGRTLPELMNCIYFLTI